MLRFAFLLPFAFGSTLLAQPAPEPSIEAKDGQARLVLRNTHSIAIRAYLIEGRSRGEPMVRFVCLDPTGSHPIAPNGTLELPATAFPSIRLAVVYADGSAAGNKALRRQLLGIRALVRRSIPETERELKETAVRQGTLSGLIHEVEAWRYDPGFWPAENMSSEDSNAYSAMCTLHRQIVEALKDGLNEGGRCRRSSRG